MPKYSSGAHNTSSRSTGLSSTKCWNTTRGIAQPHRRYRGLRTLCGDHDTCAIIEVNHLGPVFFSHPCAKTPILCAETPICAKTAMITVVVVAYRCELSTSHLRAFFLASVIIPLLLYFQNLSVLQRGDRFPRRILVMQHTWMSSVHYC